MKRIAVAAALVLASAISSTALAASHDSRGGSSFDDADPRASAASDERDADGARTAEGFFDNFRGDRDSEHGRRHRHHWDDDDDDDGDDGSASAGRGGAARPADPNSANAPVPDSGVFNGKARPKVEVQ